MNKYFSDGTIVSWHCLSCGATGQAGYNLVFDQRYNVKTADGNPWSGNED